MKTTCVLAILFASLLAGCAMSSTPQTDHAALSEQPFRQATAGTVVSKLTCAAGKPVIIANFGAVDVPGPLSGVEVRLVDIGWGWRIDMTTLTAAGAAPVPAGHGSVYYTTYCTGGA